MNVFINRRARQAYAESEDWPRWLVTGEERIVSADGMLPYSQVGLRDIGTIKRIHDAPPFKRCAAGEYIDWVAEAEGVQITGYVPAASTSVIVTGDLVPDGTGIYILSDDNLGGKPTYYLNGDSTGATASGNILYWDLAGAPNWLLSYYVDEGTFGTWVSLSDTPDPTTAEDWLESTGFGIPAVEIAYSAFITYKAAFSTTYGTGDGEENEVPEEWFEFMATGAAGDFLCSDKETENGLLLKGEARTDLDQQLEKITRQNGSKAQTRMLSHSAMQAR
jgi:hypothetical protein